MPRRQHQSQRTEGIDPTGTVSILEKALFDEARAGLEVYDLQLRILRANEAVLAMRGLPADLVIGASLSELDSRLPLAPIMEEVLEHGGPVLDRPVSVHPPGDPDNRHDYAITGYLLRNNNQTAGAASMIHDVTEQVRTQKELDLLGVARDRIGSTLDAVATAQEFSEMAVPAFADAVAVDLLDCIFTGDAPVGPVTTRLTMRRAAFKAREGHYGAYPVGSYSQFAFPTPYTQALADMRPRLVESMPPGAGWLTRDRARAEFISRAGVHSLIVTPLTVHGLVMGLASFYRAGSRSEPFDEEDVSLATQLASRTAMCIDNARRFTREHSVATTLQRSLLPRVPPDIPAVDSSHSSTPGRYGAHWFDVLPLSSCRVGLIIGYVPGEDLQAASSMGRLRTAALALAAMDLTPDEMLTHLDDVAQRLAREQDADPVTLHHARPPFTATCLYMTYDPVTRMCAAASAGHDSPLLTSCEGVVSTLEVPCGSPLSQGDPYELRTVKIPVGSLLTLYSDGSKQRHPAGFRERLSQLRDVVADTSATPDQITDTAAYEVLRDGVPPDGAALLVARTRGLDDDKVASWTFPAEPASVPEARNVARERLRHWKIDEHIATTDLIVSELATNVISHADGAIRMRLILDRTLTIEVSDDADTAPHLRHAKLQDEGGRGLFIVASLTRRWGTRYEDTGKTIWAEEELTPA